MVACYFGTKIQLRYSEVHMEKISAVARIIHRFRSSIRSRQVVEIWDN